MAVTWEMFNEHFSLDDSLLLFFLQIFVFVILSSIVKRNIRINLAIP